MPSPGNLSNPEIEARSPALQADSLPSEPPGKIAAPFKNFGIVLPLTGEKFKRPTSCARETYPNEMAAAFAHLPEDKTKPYFLSQSTASAILGHSVLPVKTQNYHHLNLNSRHFTLINFRHNIIITCAVLFSCLVMSDSLRPHGL